MVNQPEVAPGVGKSGSFEVSATHGHTDLSDREGVQQSGRHGLVRAAAGTTADATPADRPPPPHAVQHFSLRRLG
jgi:hypothetical protein